MLNKRRAKSTFAAPIIVIAILSIGCIVGYFHRQKGFILILDRRHLAVDTTTALLPRCPLPTIATATPATSASLSWDYYNALVDENSIMSFRARSFLSYARDEEHNRVRDHDESKPRIPHRLVFTHQDDLFDCSKSASNSASPQMYNLAENAKATVNAYARIWPDLQFAFLTNDDCIDLINRTEPDLIPYFESLPGMYKANLCRAADLTLHGGYYFDVDILVVQPYEAPADAKFVTVKGVGFPEYGFFQAFFAAEKGCAIARRSLKVMLEALSGERPQGEFLGPTALMEAWMEAENITNASRANYILNNVHLLNEVHLHSLSEVSKHPKLSVVLASPIGFNLIQRIPRGYGDDCQFQEGACNFVVLDESDGSVYFYSRVIGTNWCGSLQKDWPCE